MLLAQSLGNGICPALMARDIIDSHLCHHLTLCKKMDDENDKPHQVSKFHSSDRLRRVKMTVGQVEYLQDLSDGWLHISDFHISCIGFIYFRQVNGTFGQQIFTTHLLDGQGHSISNFEACPSIYLSLHDHSSIRSVCHQGWGYQSLIVPHQWSRMGQLIFN